MPSILDLAVVINLSRIDRRDILAGLSRRLHQLRRPCRMNVIPNAESLTTAALDALLDGGVGGIVSTEKLLPEVVRRLESNPVPLVVVGMYDDWTDGRAKGTAFVRNDDEAVGAAAAERFLAGGRFKSFGMVGSEDRRYWSAMRARGFLRRLRREGRTAGTFDVIHRAAHSEEDEALATWLASLPLPAAVFVAADTRVPELLAAAQSAGLAIPRDISVITTDNGLLVCDSTKPTITAITLSHVAEGELAADALAEIVDSEGEMPTRTFLNRRMEVAERESIRGGSTSFPLYLQIDGYLLEHAMEPLTAEGVAGRFGVPRRCADMVYSKEKGLTLSRRITEVRLDAVAELLRSGNLPIDEVAEKCAFANANSLRNIFKRRFGKSMRAWRKSGLKVWRFEGLGKAARGPSRASHCH